MEQEIKNTAIAFLEWVCSRGYIYGGDDIWHKKDYSTSTTSEHLYEMFKTEKE